MAGYLNCSNDSSEVHTPPQAIHIQIGYSRISGIPRGDTEKGDQPDIRNIRQRRSEIAGYPEYQGRWKVISRIPQLGGPRGEKETERGIERETGTQRNRETEKEKERGRPER